VKGVVGKFVEKNQTGYHYKTKQAVKNEDLTHLFFFRKIEKV